MNKDYFQDRRSPNSLVPMLQPLLGQRMRNRRFRNLLLFLILVFFGTILYSRMMIRSSVSVNTPLHQDVPGTTFPVVKEAAKLDTTPTTSSPLKSIKEEESKPLTNSHTISVINQTNPDLPVKKEKAVTVPMSGIIANASKPIHSPLPIPPLLGNSSSNTSTPTKWRSKLAFVGLLTVASKSPRRFLIRSTYLRLPKQPSLDFRFVICKPSSFEEAVLLTLESSQYGDILVLNCTENMDDGKTFSYFSTMGRIADPDSVNASTIEIQPVIPNQSKIAIPSKRDRRPTAADVTPSTPAANLTLEGLTNHLILTTQNLQTTYDFVFKVDDDCFLHLPNLAKELNNTPKAGVYYGREPPGTGFMAGMGYGVSFDIVRYIFKDPYPAQNRIGQEDSVFANWVYRSSLLKHWISNDKEFYDDPVSNEGWAHPYTPGTILIHRLKDEKMFLNASAHFLNEHSPSVFQLS